MRLRSSTMRGKPEICVIDIDDDDVETKPVIYVIDDDETKPLICVIDDDNDDDFESSYNKKNTGDKKDTRDQRRQLRSGYGAIINLIKDKTDDIGKADSKKFKAIMDEVDQMHQLVKNPREQISDGEALLGLVGSLEASLRSYTAGGITPTDFISRLLSKFGHEKRYIHWKELGLQVSPVLKRCGGCCTMLRTMKLEFKQRKVPIYRKRRTRRSAKEIPEQLESAIEEIPDTDTNMAVMFEILRKKKSVKLENLVLNRKSFAQTVENLFALSFLVKDGRVLMVVDEKGSHLVSPRNAPSSRAVMSREVVHSHFIFRIDFRDWKLMKATVPEGEELMPVRNGVKLCDASQEEEEELMAMSSQSELTNTSICKAELVSKNFQAARTIPLKTYFRRPRVLVDREIKGERMS